MMGKSSELPTSKTNRYTRPGSGASGGEEHVDPSDHDRNGPHNGGPVGGREPTHANGHLERNDSWLRSVVENSSEVVKVVDPDGTLRYASPAFGRVFGYDPGEAVGTMNVLDHVHPYDLPHVLAESEGALSEGGTVSNRAEYRFRHADGSWRWVESVGTYLLDDPHVKGVVMTVRDVTGRKEAEEALRESEAEVFSVLESITDAFFSLDREWRFVYVNPRAQDLFSNPREDLVGEKIWEDRRFTPSTAGPWRKAGRSSSRRSTRRAVSGTASGYTPLRPGSRSTCRTSPSAKGPRRP
jgi:PAS domain S-box-containing protein